MIRKSTDGRSWVVIPGGKAACVSCPARGFNNAVLSCRNRNNGGSGLTNNSFLPLCKFDRGNYGRVLVDSPEARAELFAAKALRS